MATTTNKSTTAATATATAKAARTARRKKARHARKTAPTVQSPPAESRMLDALDSYRRILQECQDLPPVDRKIVVDHVLTHLKTVTAHLSDLSTHLGSMVTLNQ